MKVLIDKASDQMEKDHVLGWPYIRVYFKGDRKPETYSGMTEGN